MIVITSGDKYIDIDAYASMIVYREYLRNKGIECVAMTSSVLNDSITESLLGMEYKLDSYRPKGDDKFIVLDVSEVGMLEKQVILENIIEIIDHHFGYEEYWKNVLGEKSQIESVGAVATQVYEKLVSDGVEEIINVDLAKLLVAAILDNTLNLKAKITTDRDINVYKELMSIIGDSDYPNKYYEEIECKIKENVVQVLRNETNIYNISRIIPKYFAQLVVFNKDIVFDRLNEIYDDLNNLDDKYVINLVCLEEGRSYIITSFDDVKEDMKSLFNKSFDSDIMQLDDIWLRKEIIKKAKEIID